MQRFDDAIASERAAFRALSATEERGRNLATRVTLEQAMRREIEPSLVNLSETERAAASVAIWQRIEQVDAANTTYVRSILPSDGWFKFRRDGVDVSRQAWLIVQHSPDAAFRRTVAARMQHLVASGDASGADFALIYDRAERADGRPQLYGSQMTCVAGRWQPAQTLDPENLDRRRADMGLQPMAEYMKNFEGRC
ncbi:hypothetical protein LK533_15470 [Sphingomonas sp. PL-96]|uniref:DUF6624 domain-containing protein n=1 Tax=Sphingomonas sp. PL-96 TaxID=2887201 RepID=UPI001E5D3EDF|nr:DUF6624 domain-containing protein [Sphingomonas sp. PL-96]MCC2978064.1 hypothetical protein [Sphingomonas sp. PL-96]